jgi:hypothetical protein
LSHHAAAETVILYFGALLAEESFEQPFVLRAEQFVECRALLLLRAEQLFECVSSVLLL